MPRNVSGIYSLPDPPVVTNTTIESLDENVTRDDIAAELTASLDRNGRGPMLAPMRVPDGDMAVPAYSWSMEANSGWYRAGMNDFRFSIGGADVLKLLPTGISPIVPIGPLSILPGTLPAPGLSFVGGPDTGGYGPIPGAWTWVQGGAEVFDLRGNTIQSFIQHRFADGTVVEPSISWVGEPDAGWYRSAPGVFRYGIGGNPIITLQAGAITTGPGVPVFIQELLTGTKGADFSGGNVTLAGAANAFVASHFVATNTAAAPFLDSTNQIHNQGMFVVGAGGAYGSIYEYSANSAAAANIIRNFVPVVAGGLGQHGFFALQGDSNSSFKIYGGSYGGGAGASLNTFYAGNQLAGISVNMLDSTPGAMKSVMYFGTIRNGTFTGTDLALAYNPYFQAQLKLYGGWTNTLSNVEFAPFIIQGDEPNGLYPGICLHGGVSGFAFTQVSNTLYGGGAGGGGPIGGWAFSSANSGMSAAAFTPVSDATLKSEIQTIKYGLRDILKLRGVRYRQAWDDQQSLGLIADEVADTFPELVGEVISPPVDGVYGTKYKTLNYMGLIGPMIEALREVSDRLTALEH